MPAAASPSPGAFVTLSPCSSRPDPAARSRQPRRFSSACHQGVSTRHQRRSRSDTGSARRAAAPRHAMNLVGSAPDDRIQPRRFTGNRSRRPGDPPPAAGQTGVEVSVLGLGGYHLGTMASEREAVRIVHEAVDARHQLPRQRLGVPRRRERDRHGQGARATAATQAFLMTKVCTHGREPRRGHAPARASRCAGCGPTTSTSGRSTSASTTTIPSGTSPPGGAVEALERGEAAGQGALRRLHRPQGPGHPPERCCAATSRSTPASSRSTASTPPSAASSARCCPSWRAAASRAIGMKCLGGDGEPVKKRASSADEALRYAMSLPVATTVSRHRLAEGAAPEPAHRARVRADDRARQMDAAAAPLRRGGRRRPLRAVQDDGRSTKARRPRSSTASPATSKSRCEVMPASCDRAARYAPEPTGC